MSHFKVSFVAAAILIGSAIAAKAEPPSYPLVCKPNAAMTATVKGNGQVLLRFRASANAGTPRAGECTWRDRPLNDDEPTTILAEDDFGRDLIDSLLSGRRFEVSVYNDGAGHMMVAAGG